MALPQHRPAGIRYVWMGKEQGGLRKRDRALGDLNAGWRNDSFRGYADYMQTGEFRAGLDRLLQLAAEEEGPVCLMCAEVLHWRCHRMLLSDALAALGGCQVQHIMQARKPPLAHRISEFARVAEGGQRLTYPLLAQPGGAVAVSAAAAGAEGKPGQRSINAYFKTKEGAEAAQEQQEEQQQLEMEAGTGEPAAGRPATRGSKRFAPAPPLGQPGIEAFMQRKPKKRP